VCAKKKKAWHQLPTGLVQVLDGDPCLIFWTGVIVPRFCSCKSESFMDWIILYYSSFLNEIIIVFQLVGFTCFLLSYSEVATEFAMSLVQTLITQDSVGVSELYNVVDALSKVCIIVDMIFIFF
jgi:hypothetical protein